MVEEVAAALFRIEIPLPATPLKSLNCYVVRGKERNLIIDSGLNHPECRAALKAGLQHLGINLWLSDFFITHLHADHIGLIPSFAREGVSKIYCGRADGEFIDSDFGIGAMLLYAERCGFPGREIRRGLKLHPGITFGEEWKPALRLLQEGDIVSVGDYRFQCVETPGHARGHLCLYELGKKLLVAGDHLLVDISPNIQLWSDDENPLRDYLDSLEKIGTLDVDLVLPGHRRMFSNCRERIAELREHHHRRAEEVLVILADGQKNAYEVAARMSWDLRFSAWEQLPVAQRWFATGEALSHLKYVQETGAVTRVENGGRVFFRLA